MSSEKGSDELCYICLEPRAPHYFRSPCVCRYGVHAACLIDYIYSHPSMGTCSICRGPWLIDMGAFTGSLKPMRPLWYRCPCNECTFVYIVILLGWSYLLNFYYDGITSLRSIPPLIYVTCVGIYLPVVLYIIGGVFVWVTFPMKYIYWYYRRYNDTRLLSTLVSKISEVKPIVNGPETFIDVAIPQ